MTLIKIKLRSAYYAKYYTASVKLVQDKMKVLDGKQALNEANRYTKVFYPKDVQAVEEVKLALGRGRREKSS